MLYLQRIQFCLILKGTSIFSFSSAFCWKQYCQQIHRFCHFKAFDFARRAAILANSVSMFYFVLLLYYTALRPFNFCDGFSRLHFNIMFTSIESFDCFSPLVWNCRLFEYCCFILCLCYKETRTQHVLFSVIQGLNICAPVSSTRA